MNDEESSVEIEFTPVSYEIGDIKEPFSLLNFDPKSLAKISVSGAHTINAVLDVRRVQGQAKPKCNVRKTFFFYTDLTTQAINLKLNVDPRITDKVHILKATCLPVDSGRCTRVEHCNSTVRPEVWGKKKFGEECPNDTDTARIIFTIPRYSQAFFFDVYVRILRSEAEDIDIPCDPQAGNEPPGNAGGGG